MNTNGWILSQEAAVFKARLIQTLKPDAILRVGSTGALQSIISDSKIPRLQVEAPSSSITTRPRTQRKELRRIGYRRFLRGDVRTFPLRKMNLKLLGRSGPELNAEMANLIVGLLNSLGYLMQIGVILSLDSNSVKVYSRVRGTPNSIEIGSIRVSIDGTELVSATTIETLRL